MSDHISEYLVNSSNLPLNGIVLCVGACRPFMTGHVHAHDVQMLWQVLEQLMERKEVTIFTQEIIF